MISKVLAFSLPDITFRSADTSSTANAWDQAATLVTTLINLLLVIAGALAIIYTIYSGILYITAAGNPDNAKKGQQGVINGIIGIIIIVMAGYIVSAVAWYAAHYTGS